MEQREYACHYPQGCYYCWMSIHQYEACSHLLTIKYYAERDHNQQQQCGQANPPPHPRIQRNQ
eukprot:3801616-Ditylum_brightwellii.AAC.1